MKGNLQLFFFTSCCTFLHLFLSYGTVAYVVCEVRGLVMDITETIVHFNYFFHIFIFSIAFRYQGLLSKNNILAFNYFSQLWLSL